MSNAHTDNCFFLINLFFTVCIDFAKQHYLFLYKDKACNLLCIFIVFLFHALHEVDNTQGIGTTRTQMPVLSEVRSVWALFYCT